MAKNVAGDVLQQNYALQQKFNEFYRQINQSNGYPFDFDVLITHLQKGVDGKFESNDFATKEVIDASNEVYINNYKGDLQKFFSEIYGITNLSEITLRDVEGFEHYMIKPAVLDADAIYACFKKIGLSSSKYMNESIVKMKKSEQERPGETYVFAHKGGAEPDAEHLGKSYNQYSIDGKTYLTIDEYMLIYQFMWWKFKIKLDKKGWTRTSTLDSDCHVMCGRSYDDGFWLYWCNRDLQYSDGGPRSVMLF